MSNTPMEKVLCVFLCVLVVLVVITFVLLPLEVVGEVQKCHVMQEMTSEYQYKWFLNGGCMVIVGGRLMTIESAQELFITIDGDA